MGETYKLPQGEVKPENMDEMIFFMVAELFHYLSASGTLPMARAEAIFTEVADSIIVSEQRKRQIFNLVADRYKAKASQK